jgi:periplasmic protein TonB
MFDTSLVRTRTVDGSKRFGVLTVSLALHSAAIIAVLSASIASVDFPTTAPDQYELFTPVTAPPAPPPALGRPAPAKPSPAAAAAPRVQTAPVAPTQIPDAVPAVEPAAASGPAVGPGGAIADGPPGVEWGEVGGMPVDQVPIAQPETPAPSGPLQPGGEVLPARVLRRVEPAYPPILIKTRVPGVVTVRCVVDRNGQIRDPEIVRSSHPAFNSYVLDAVRQWKFAPGSMRGHAVDTWFELTVRFAVK